VDAWGHQVFLGKNDSDWILLRLGWCHYSLSARCDGTSGCGESDDEIRDACVCVAVGCRAPSGSGYAQAAITGVVKDTSGGVLPGVTVEVASPVLIEKVRTVSTDGTGQYRVVDLRPGTYSVTFTLPGFRTVKRDGIELTGTFVATVSADLSVGQLDETITVGVNHRSWTSKRAGAADAER
jgi:hypothetical protein